MTIPSAVWLGTQLFGVLLLLHAVLTVTRLPEPAEPDGKPLYEMLFPDRRIATLVAIGFCLQLVSSIAPPGLRPAFVVWASSVLVLVAVDALTTWLPKRVNWLCAAELAAALGLGALIDSARAVPMLVGAALGAVGGWLLFWLMWRLVGGLGFGDVRLAGLVGALAGAWSLEAWWLTFLAGSIAGVLWGLIGRLRRGRRTATADQGTGSHFPYGPALWLGPYVAFLILRLTG